MKIQLLFVSLLWSYLAYGQGTISGTVTDAQTGEDLIGAAVYEGNSKVGSITNLYGFFSLKVPVKDVKLIISYVGFQPQTISFHLLKDTVIHVKLNSTIELEGVLVKGNSPEEMVQSSQMSKINISPRTMKQLPVLLGETDVVKFVQLLPGVQSGTEGSSGLYVRGGGPDQNLILLDGVPVYNVNHLFGFMSVFNTDAINSVSLIKGGYPARYGGRLSSVLDIRMKEGNSNEFHGEGAIGIISSNLTLEGPIKNGKTSFMVSGRRSYIDIITYPFQMLFNKTYTNGKAWFGYFLQDFNGKINHKFSDKSRLYLSFYTGKDKFFLKDKYKDSGGIYSGSSYNYKDDMGLQWGNFTSALRWNYIMNNSLFSNLTFTVSNYKFKVYEDYESEYSDGADKTKEDFYFEYYSKIRDYALKYDFDFYASPNHYLKFGLGNTLHLFSPGVTVMEESYEGTGEKLDTLYGNKNIPANEAYAYIEDEMKLGSKIKMNAGVHFSDFLVQNTNYWSLEPRLSLRYLIIHNLSLKASYVHMKQYLHLLSNSTMGLPTDLWVPPTAKIKPQESWQAAFGISYALHNKYRFSVESYYKDMKGIIEYSEGASFFDLNSGNWEDLVTSGTGRSYGVELFVEKTSGKSTGWLGYTLSWSDRKFEEISYGKTYPYNYDARHDISFVYTYKIKENIDFGLTWVFRTGYPFTLEDEKFISPVYQLSQKNESNGYYPYYDRSPDIENNLVDYFETRNSYRMPNYHRLDLGFRFVKQREKYKRTWSIGAYNAYSRMNPFFLYQEYEYNSHTDEYNMVMKQVSLLPIIPYIRWGFKF